MTVEPSFRDLFIEITGKCNLKCCHCFRPECEEIDVPVKELKDRIHQVKSNNIILTGGEPTLHPDLRHIISIAKERVGEDGKVILITNAARWSEAIMRTIYEADVVNVSLDWADDRHDENRGMNGLQENVGRLIDQLTTMTMPHKARPKINLLVTMFHENMDADNIDAIVRFAHEHNVDDIVFDRYVPCFSNPSALTTAEMKIALESLDALSSEADASTGSPQITIYEIFANILYGYSTPRCRCKGRVFCDIYGKWSPCPFYPVRFDNPSKVVHERAQEDLPGACIGCEHADSCHGGCPATRLVVHGTLKKRDPLCPFRVPIDFQEKGA